MWARRTRTAKRNAHGVARIRRDSYNTKDGFSVKSGSGWWEIRAKVMKRAKNRCEDLGCSEKAEEVHHIVPLSRGGTTTMANLIALCKCCHDRRHPHLFRARRK